MSALADAFATALEEATAALPIALTPEHRARIAGHWELVLAWNAKINLTAITDPKEAAWLHYRDSLEVLPFLEQGPIADIGSGAGFPGLPLAIVSGRPTTLVEPRRKRVSFLRTAIATLGLSNTTVLEARSTDAPPTGYANVVTRATFGDEGSLRSCADWVAPGGQLIALRSAGAGPRQGRRLPTRAVDYELLGRPRVLEIWTQRDLSGP